ncbi:MAG: rhodanese-related sulfurtransferase [Patescibacteria group bacterium]
MSSPRNHLSKEECLKRLAAENFKRLTLSFYRYVRIEKPREFRDQLFLEWDALGVFGRIYVAREGINAQLSVPEHNVEALKKCLNDREELRDLRLNWGLEHTESFYKLMIKVRPQIVTDGLPEDAYDLNNTGTHLNADQFNKALEDPNAVVVDMRNFYESRIGRFEDAICPDAPTFKEELPLVKEMLKGKEDKKILMYCTGGIRCEKASAYLKHQGFTDVSQLEGGVIKYVRDLREQKKDSKFLGKNFVFDERISETVTDDILTECDQCESKWDIYTNCSNASCNLLFIQCPACAEKWAGACSEPCREIAVMDLEDRRAFYARQTSTTYEVYKSRIRPSLKATKVRASQAL